jgi:CubicO group peptidase (beta-lactamase class C family)
VNVGAYFEGDAAYGEFAHAAARWRLCDLLSMQSGLAWDEETAHYNDVEHNSCAAMEASGDWLRFVLGCASVAPAGAVFCYSSGVTQLLAHVLMRAVSGGVEEIDAYARRVLFAPLGIADGEWHWRRGAAPRDECDAEGGLFMTPRALAKIGRLYLHDGVCEGGGERLMP